jgi:hypothetical protein
MIRVVVALPVRHFRPDRPGKGQVTMKSELGKTADALCEIAESFLTDKTDARGVFLVKEPALKALLLGASRAGAFDKTLSDKLELLRQSNAGGGAIWCETFNYLVSNGKISSPQRDDPGGWRASLNAVAHYVRLLEPTESKGDGYLPVVLRGMLQVSANTLNDYARAAGVTIPKVGKRNHRYTDDEAFKIADSMAKRSTSSVDRERADRVRKEIAKQQ